MARKRTCAHCGRKLGDVSVYSAFTGLRYCGRPDCREVGRKAPVERRNERHDDARERHRLHLQMQSAKRSKR